jgi:hypothetical protein
MYGPMMAPTNGRTVDGQGPRGFCGVDYMNLTEEAP